MAARLRIFVEDKHDSLENQDALEDPPVDDAGADPEEESIETKESAANMEYRVAPGLKFVPWYEVDEPEPEPIPEGVPVPGGSEADTASPCRRARV